MKQTLQTLPLILLFAAGSLPAAEESFSEEPVAEKAEKATKNKAVSADSAIVTLQSTITGNREQPKVLYIVPWQAPDGPESLRQGFQSDLDELFQPLERDEFLRQLKHRGVSLTTPPQKQE